MNNLVLATDQSGTALAGTAQGGTPLSERQKSRTYLSVQVSETLSAVLEMNEVHEVLAIAPHQLTPIFNMPSCVLGLLTRRSRVVWIVDLAHLLLDEPLAPAHLSGSAYKPYTIVVASVTPPWVSAQGSETQQAGDRAETHLLAAHRPAEQPVLLGFVVHSVQGSVQLEAGSVQRPQGHFSPKFAPCLSGTALQDGTLFHVLSANAIARLPALSTPTRPATF